MDYNVMKNSKRVFIHQTMLCQTIHCSTSHQVSSDNKRYLDLLHQTAYILK